MKVAHITPVYPPRLGGMGTVAQAYAQSLSARGVDVDILTPRYKDVEFTQEKGQTIHALRPLYSWGNAALLPSLLWRLRSYDVLHLHYPFYGGAILTALASIIWRKPLVITFHMENTAKGWLGWIFTLYKWIARPFIFAVANGIFVSSLDYAHANGLHSKKLLELPFWIEPARLADADRARGRARIGLDLQTPLVVFVGGLDDAHYFKGIAVLLEACARLPKDRAWHVLIVGEGNLRSRYELAARAHGIEHRVHFFGRANDRELADAFAAADAHVLPAINRCEAFGLVTLEAAHMGLPSIVTNLPGVRTLIEHKQTGLLVEPGRAWVLHEALESLLFNHALSREMGERARARALEYYTKDAIIERLMSVYALLNH